MDLNNFGLGDLVRYTDNLKDRTNWQNLLNTFNTNLTMYFMLACNRFKWECNGLNPEFRYSKLIEYYLACKGQCFIDVETMSVMQGVMIGDLDEFGDPTKFEIFGYNGKNRKIKNINEVIWIRNNNLCIPTLYYILKYCNRINKIETTMDLNINAQKTPFVIETDPLINFSMKNIFDEIEKMSDVVMVDQSKSLTDNVKILDLNVPYLVDQLHDQKINEENELMRFLGVDTVQEKNAHMIYAEIQNTNEIVDNFTDIFVSERKCALKNAEKFGIDLKLSVLDINPEFGVDKMGGVNNAGDDNATQIN
nr:MAG TPA: upper collar protein [Caudoviricetes sp.]